jgi:membrane protease YdiL (CAAX protease family)
MTLSHIISALVTLLIPLSGLLWLVIYNRYRTQGEILTSEPRLLVPWNGFPHVALAFFIYVVLPLVWLFLLQRWFDLTPDADLTQMPQVIAWLLAGDSLLKFVALALVVTFLRIDLSVSVADLGFRIRKVKNDLLLGLISFIAVAPVIYFLQFILKWIYNQFADEEAAHPIEKLLQDNGSASVVFWAIFAAVIAAPIVEEFLFRVILQGWLEKAFYRTRLLVDAQLAGGAASEDVAMATPAAPTFMWQPIILSSITFAILHAGHGPDPVPLFFLAMVLGYLYAKTHRILPGIVVHMVLNGLSMLILLSSI